MTKRNRTRSDNMMKKNKLIFHGFIIIMTAGMITICHPEPVRAATEADLHYVMGFGKLEKQDLKKKINDTTFRLALENSYNETVRLAKENGIDITFDETAVKKGRNAYSRTLDLFRQAKDADEVAEAFNDYNYMVGDVNEAYDVDDDFSEVDTSDIRNTLIRLKDLKKIAEDKTNIGGLSNNLPKPVKGDFILKGYSKDTAAFATKKNEKIYCVFNGLIIKSTDDSVTLSAGKTIRVTYKGIKPLYSKGRISQKDVIGTAKGKTVKITMQEAGRKRNILLAGGKAGYEAYNGYLSENPWEADILDFSSARITYLYKNKTGNKKKTRSSVMTNGKKKTLKVETPKKSTSDNLFTNDPFADSSTRLK